MMSKFTEIIQYRPKSQREDFLEYLIERGLSESERNEIVSIIISYFPENNDWTLIHLIDLINDERIVNEDLINTLLSDLLHSKSYLMKLSILDYIGHTQDLYKEASIKINYPFLEKLANSKKEKLIVRNQTLFILLDVFPAKKEEYVSQLKVNLKRTKDYRTHVRLYSNLPNDNIMQRDALEFIEISNAKNLGKAVETTIEELKKELDI